MNKNKDYLFEGCIDSIDDANHYASVGIDRLELCSQLELGGLCPTLELVDYCLNQLKINGVVMLRLRNDFTFLPEDLIFYKQYIEQVKALGAKNFIFGFNIYGKVDVVACQQLIALMDGCHYAFHMAVDAVNNYHNAIETAIKLKFHWILTKGGNDQPAMQNLASIKEIIALYGKKIKFLIGGKVDSQNWSEIAKVTGATWFHGKKIK